MTPGHVRPASNLERIVSGPAALGLLVLLGVALRAWAYFSNPPLWLDEILLARNIIELPMRELLFEPLGLDQIAPRGFLLVERLAVLAFGPSELALRLFPFLCGIAGVVLFRRLAERTLCGLAVPIALTLFAIAVPFLKYGAEVKQYESDATAAILLTLLALGLADGRPVDQDSTRRRVLIGCLGFVIVCFSQASVLVMAGLGVALAGEWLVTRQSSIGRALVTTLPLWALASLAAVAIGLASMTPSTREFMANFWATGFTPRPLSLTATPAWFAGRLVTLFSDPTLLQYRWAMWFVVLALIGVATLWTRRRMLALLAAGPVVMALSAAAAQQYPFRGRLAVHLLPVTILLVAAGTDWLRARLSRAHVALGLVPVAACLGPAILAIAASPPPYDTERHRAVLQYIQQHRQPDDVIYVLPLSRIGLLYYGPAHGVPWDGFITGICDRYDTRAYVRHADQLRGSPRVWVITTGARPFRSPAESIRDYLGTIGVRQDALAFPSLTFETIRLELYDLSDPVRLSSADVESFAVRPMTTDPRPSCRPWVAPGAALTVK